MSDEKWIDDFLKGLQQSTARKLAGEKTIPPDPTCKRCEGAGMIYTEVRLTHQRGAVEHGRNR
jgi:hypothetical protein